MFAYTKKKGFTLIELLVVVAILGLISSIVFASMNNARKKARDAKRLSDMRQIQTALDIYYDKFGSYPNEAGSGWEQSSQNGGNFIEALQTEGFLSNNIVDPINNTQYYYAYYKYDVGQGYCNGYAQFGSWYALGVNDMETSGRPHLQSPGFSCAGSGARDWQIDFDWVGGKFEK